MNYRLSIYLKEVECLPYNMLVMTNEEYTIKIKLKLLSWHEQNWVDREYDDSLGLLLILRKPFRR